MTWILLFAVISSLFYFRVKQFLFLSLIAALLIVVTIFHWASSVSIALFWIIYIGVFLLLRISSFRRSLITSHIMKWFHSSQPEISAVERDVLESGNIWVEKEFFSGNPNFDNILNQPQPKLSIEEQAFFDNQVTTLCGMLDDWKITHQIHDLPKEVWDYIKSERFWGLSIEKKYNGLGFSPYAHSQIVSRIASKSMSAALTVMVPNSLGPAEFLSHYGTDQQKQDYLPRLAIGEEVACFALTALNAGSDATAITDRGIVCEQEFEGKRQLGIRLCFDKRYITLAPVATLIGLAFKLFDPDHLLGAQEKRGITLAIVPSHLPGVSQGLRHDPMDLAFMNGPIRGKDVFIPLDYVIGGVDNIGKGWRMLMECLSIGRSISLPALSYASAQISYRMSSAYAVIRKQFQRSIGQFDGIQLPLAHIAGLTYMTQSLRLLTLEAVNQGLRPAVASAIAKYHCTEMARVIINHAMDIHGGRAVQNGPRNYMAALYACAPICITVEGANILTRNLIIYGQGALRCHPYLQHEIDAAMKEDLSVFDDMLMKHVAMLIQNKIQILCHRFMPVKNAEVALQRFSVLFSFVSDLTMAIVGKELKFKEALSALLGDILSYLYIATAVLKYFNNNGKLESEQMIKQWSLEYCLAKIESTFNELFLNYPSPRLGKVLRCLTLKRQFNGPSHKLSSALAKFVQTDQECRERLTSTCYIGDNAEDPCYRVEHAWRQVLQYEGDLSQDKFTQLVWDALQVDEFEGAFE